MRKREKGERKEIRKESERTLAWLEEKRSAREIGFPELSGTRVENGGARAPRSFRFSPFNGLLVGGRIEREFLFRAARQIVARPVESAMKQW